MPATPLFAANVESPTVPRLVILSPPDGSFGASLNSISYAPISMRAEHSGIKVTPLQPSFTSSHDQSLLPQPHPNAQLGFCPHTSLIPVNYDGIVDTVTDHDSESCRTVSLALIFFHRKPSFIFGSATQEKMCMPLVNDHLIDRPPSWIISIMSALPKTEENRRVDELAVSIDFPQDFDASSPSTNCYNCPTENSHYGRLLPTKNVRFDDSPTWIPHREKCNDGLFDHDYFNPAITTDREQSADVPTHLASVQYKPTPFSWFRLVVDNNYAICIPRTRSSLHANSITPSRTENEVRF